MKTVRGKFRCHSVKPHDGGVDVALDAVDEAEWSAHTPSGSLQMFITNPACRDAFEEGKTYYVDVSLAEG